jgi:putative hydrolase of the HAD superfamily
MPIADMIDRLLFPILPLPTQLVKGGRLKAPIKALLLDVYGTLLVSASGDINKKTIYRDTAKRLDQLFYRFNIKKSPNNLRKELMDTIYAHHHQSKAAGIDHPEIVIESIWQSILGWYDNEKIKQFAIEYELIVNPVWPMPYLWVLLKHLFEKKIPVGIISNAQFYTPLLIEAFADAPLKHLGFAPDLIFFSYQYGRAKPSSYLFEKAAQHLSLKGIHAKNILYLGNDVRNDILPAQMVGFQTALFAGDARSLRLRKNDPDCYGKMADMIITDLVQLLDLI